ncbi:WXG100 family type VII secretion target [Amycolatopsis sp. NPDC059657]|uniref:WXG100 family type VII secretion target n=1 Tax=Amycolatopsis sp. NPDC059657 TaxID=3346899 RepID=UPI00366DAD7D
MTTGQIKYQYSALDDGVNQMRKVNSNIEHDVTQLTNDVKKLLGDFMGASSQSYDTKAKTIKQNLNESNAKLNTLSGNVAKGASNMSTTDSREAGRF